MAATEKATYLYITGGQFVLSGYFLDKTVFSALNPSANAARPRKGRRKDAVLSTMMSRSVTRRRCVQRAGQVDLASLARVRAADRCRDIRTGKGEPPRPEGGHSTTRPIRTLFAVGLDDVTE
jgi:hypothetical protein